MGGGGGAGGATRSWSENVERILYTQRFDEEGKDSVKLNLYLLKNARWLYYPVLIFSFLFWWLGIFVYLTSDGLSARVNAVMVFWICTIVFVALVIILRWYIKWVLIDLLAGGEFLGAKAVVLHYVGHGNWEVVYYRKRPWWHPFAISTRPLERR